MPDKLKTLRREFQEMPASSEVEDMWRNKRMYNRKGTVFGFVRSVFLRKCSTTGVMKTWLNVRWLYKRIVTAISTVPDVTLKVKGVERDDAFFSFWLITGCPGCWWARRVPLYGFLFSVPGSSGSSI